MPKPTKFDADLPISRPSQDSLNKAPFAHRIAESIFGWEGDNGCVIALVGEWGSGKTSVLNLIERRMKLLSLERSRNATVREFLEEEKISDAQDLEDMLSKYEESFNSIDDDIKILHGNIARYAAFRVAHLRQSGLPASDADRAERLWRSLAISGENPQFLFIRFSPWILGHRIDLTMAYLAEVARSVGDKLGIETQKAIADFLGSIEKLSKLAAPIGQLTGFGGASQFGRLVGTGARYGADHFSQGISIQTAKDRLRTALERQSSRLVVVIDDLDRLAPSEAQLMISLVKSQMDLPRIIHVLAYDKTRLELAMGRKPAQFDKEYLSKIVQVEIELPPVSKKDTYQMFSKSIQWLVDFYEDVPVSRLITAQNDIINRYLVGPRDIIRLGNSIQFHWRAVAGHVDPIDFVILEVLRLFDRNVFQWIRDNIDSLNGSSPLFSNAKSKKKMILDIVDSAYNPSAASYALRFLFPIAADWLNATSVGDNKDTSSARRDYRLSSPSASAAYLRLTPSIGALSQSESIALRKSLYGDDSLSELREIALDEHSIGGKAARIMLIESITADVENGKSIGIDQVLRLLSIADELIRRGDAETGFLAPTLNDERIRYFLVKYIESLEPNVRSSALKDILASGESLSALAGLCRSALGDLRQGGASGRDMISDPDEVNQLREALLERVRATALAGALWAQADPAGLLWFWQQGTTDTEVRDWLSAELASDDAFEQFMKAAPGFVYSSAGVYRTVSRSIWSKMIDIDGVLERAKKWVFGESRSNEERVVAKEFMEAIERGDA